MTNSSGQPVRLEDEDSAPMRFTAWLLCAWGWLSCGLLTLFTWRLAPDGVYYVQMAESLASGNGITAAIAIDGGPPTKMLTRSGSPFARAAA